MAVKTGLGKGLDALFANNIVNAREGNCEVHSGGGGNYGVVSLGTKK